MNYPKQHEDLLRKAGLLGKGKLEVRAIHTIREHSISQDGGTTFEKQKRPDSYKSMTTSTSLVKNTAGRIAGYWADGLTAEERRIINEECGVPFFFLDDRLKDTEGKYINPDTRINIVEGMVFDLEVPADVATVLVLKEVASTIGIDKKDAMMHGADFYFHSQEEEEQETKAIRATRRNAAKLVEELNSKEKHKVVRILILQDELMADQFISKDAASDLFEDLVFSMPNMVLKANDIAEKDSFIVAMTLVKAGYIEASSNDGPYYKNETVFGTRVHLADSLADLLKAINKFPDLLKEYDKINGAATGVFDDKANDKPSVVTDLLSRHGLVKGNDQVGDLAGAHKALRKKIQLWKIDQVIAALDDEDIEHEFDANSDIKEVKAFYVENHKD